MNKEGLEKVLEILIDVRDHPEKHPIFNMMNRIDRNPVQNDPLTCQCCIAGQYAYSVYNFKGKVWGAYCFEDDLDLPLEVQDYLIYGYPLRGIDGEIINLQDIDIHKAIQRVQVLIDKFDIIEEMELQYE